MSIKSLSPGNVRVKHYIKMLREFRFFLDSNKLLTFPGGKPLVSIISLFQSNPESSYACLKSIVEYADAGLPYEIIIVDNNSGARTGLLLGKIYGAKILRGTGNNGSATAWSRMLEHASGEYALFLDSGTELLKDSLPQALETMKSVHACAAVTAKIVSHTGSLKEAGSIIWNDGSCSEYGKGKSPSLPEFNFCRAVDSCTGAFMLTRTSLVRRYGRFDENLTIAYKVSDYCLWLKERGMKLIYNPRVTARHSHFRSNGFIETIRLREKDRKIFLNKHADTLKNHYEPRRKNIVSARFSVPTPANKQILYVDDRVPHLDMGSGYPRSNFILKCIRELGYDVTIFPNRFSIEENWDAVYRDINPFNEIAPGHDAKHFSGFMSKRRGYYGIVWISRIHNMRSIAKKLGKHGEFAKIVYDAEAIYAERKYMKKKLENRPFIDQGRMMQEEFNVCRNADILVSVSESDASKFRSHGLKNVYVLGIPAEKRETPFPFKDRKNLLFLGNMDCDDSPNVDSILFFAREVLPLIKNAIPDMELHIAGSCRSKAVRSLKKSGIHVHGLVSDVFDFYNKCRVFIAPTRYAAGIPCKVIEAASFGLPVVATEILANQLGWNNREHIMACKPEKNDFAAGVIELYRDEKLWMHIREKALNVIESDFKYASFKNTVSKILLQRRHIETEG